jgi:hypothetical protein
MTDFVNALYGTSPKTADATPDATAPLGELAKLFYSTPPPPAAQPGPGEFFDRYAMFKRDFDQHAGLLHDVFGVGAAAREASDRAFVSMTGELGLEDATTIALHREIVQGLLPASAPADGNSDENADVAVLASHIQIRETLRQELGEAASTDIIRRTEALIAATPELQRLLEHPLRAANAQPFLLLARHVAGR